MHQIVMILIYLFISYIVALLGRNRKLGFWGYLFVSIFLSPLVGLILVLLTDPKVEKIKNGN